MGSPPARSARRAIVPPLGASALTAVLVWAYWPTLGGLAVRWSDDPRYSHGFLVPVFAAYLLWWRRGLRPRGVGATAAGSWCGVGLVAVSAAAYLAGVRYYLPWVEAASISPAAAGVALVFGGAGGLRWAGPSAVFLLFMIPLPYRVEGAAGAPLQTAATRCSTFALQTLGLPAIAEGNVIALNGAKIGVVEACNGLGMLVTFTALATGLAMVVARPRWERWALVAGAAPVALAANVARITAAGAAREWAGARVAWAVYHDLAGWLMMPLAVGLLAAELWALGLVSGAGPGSGTGVVKGAAGAWR